MASDRKFTAIFILYRSGAPSLWDPAFVSMTPSRCLLPDQESLFLRLSPWEPGGVPGVKPCKWGPLSLHNCRPPLGRWEYLSLTEVCTQLLATHPNNNLSAPTSWVILMAFFQTNLERAISMNVPVLCSSVEWFALWPQFSDGSRKSQLSQFIQFFPVQMGMMTSKLFPCWSLVYGVFLKLLNEWMNE
jgi:hypothetical protein